MIFMIYLMEVVAYTGAMITIYMLFLRDKVLFTFGRLYLLASAVLPAFLPLVFLPAPLQQRLGLLRIFQVSLPEIVIAGGAQKTFTTSSGTPLFWLVYSLVTLVIMTWHLVGVWQVMRVVRLGVKEDRGDYTLVVVDGYGPGSFGRYIFFPSLVVHETILRHELAHIRRRHSVDVVLLMLLQSVFWPNVLLLWIRNELKEVHEFEADRLTDADTAEYAELILCSVFKTNSTPPMHLFINHPLKRRIMMLRKKDGKASLLKAVILVAASSALITTVGISVQSCNKRPAAFRTTNSLMPTKTTPNEQVKATADVMPVYTRGSIAEFLAKTLKYPDQARKSGIEGRVVVKFVVTKDGSVTNVQVVKSPDTSLSRAATDAIAQMNNWQPGRMKNGEKVDVWFYLPVLFKLQ
jgi:TonB family protein